MDTDDEFLLEVWAVDAHGNKVYPYKGRRGTKRGHYSVNFTTSTKGFRAMTEAELIDAIESGRFAQRGTIRMLPIGHKPGAERNAFAPTHFRGAPISKIT